MLRCEAIVNCMLHIARVLICLRQQLALVLQEAYIESELQPFIEQVAAIYRVCSILHIAPVLTRVRQQLVLVLHEAYIMQVAAIYRVSCSHL